MCKIQVDNIIWSFLDGMFMFALLIVIVLACLVPKELSLYIEWQNCNPDAPNFSGVCCRWLEKSSTWDCRRLVDGESESYDYDYDEELYNDDAAILPFESNC